MVIEDCVVNHDTFQDVAPAVLRAGTPLTFLQEVTFGSTDLPEGATLHILDAETPEMA